MVGTGRGRADKETLRLPPLVRWSGGCGSSEVGIVISTVTAALSGGILRTTLLGCAYISGKTGGYCHEVEMKRPVKDLRTLFIGLNRAMALIGLWFYA